MAAMIGRQGGEYGATAPIYRLFVGEQAGNEGLYPWEMGIIGDLFCVNFDG